MSLSNATEAQMWEEVKANFPAKRIKWGTVWSWNFRNDPKRLPFVLARYKFASKMAKNAKSVIELGCGEGIGAPILAEGRKYFGVDYDKPQIESAKKIFDEERFGFESADFFDKTFGEHDLVVSLDVIEHIYKEYEETYVKALADHVNDGGIVVCGTPNETTTPYASKLSREAHVNMYSQERLRTLFEKYFQNVFSFGMNDEVVHTGFAKMAQYLFVVACNKR